ncbi:hypothetical protein ACUXA1_005381, partial [Serratia sp. 121840017-1]
VFFHVIRACSINQVTCRYRTPSSMPVLRYLRY